MSQAIKLGLSRHALYSLRDSGLIEPLTRGFYRLANLPAVSNPDLAAVGLRYPKAVVCLVSAQAFHGLTTQIPHEVFVALPPNSRVPSMKDLPLRVFRFSENSFKAGIEKHMIDDIAIRVYSPEKTLADCFKFRNKIGMDIVLESLKIYMAREKPRTGDLLKYARICRVETVMRPYLEASL